MEALMSKLKLKAYVVPFIEKFACYGIRCLLAGSDGTTPTVGISVVGFGDGGTEDLDGED